MDRNIKLVLKNTSQRKVEKLSEKRRKNLKIKISKKVIPGARSIIAMLMFMAAITYYCKFMSESSNNYLVDITKGLIYPKRFIAASSSVIYDK
jgi:hypothetical protein